MMGAFESDTVVVPIDFSKDSVQALEKALQLADKPEDIHVLYVLEPLSAMEPGIVWGAMSDEDREDKAFEALQQRLSENKYTGIKLVVEIGNPGHCVADYAEKVSAGLIVVSSHGKTGVSRLMLGSVAERIVRFSRCPVLVIKSTA